MILSLLLAIFPVVAGYRVQKAHAPSLLLDLYNSNVIEKCDFQDLSSIAPIEVNPGTPNSVLTFDLTHVKPIGVVHVVFDGKETGQTFVKKTVEVFINGNREVLNLEPIRTSSIAPVKHYNLHGSTNLTVNMRELEEVNVSVDNIFLMTSIDESCKAWKEFRSSGTPTKTKGGKLKKRSVERRATKTGCTRIPFEVDLRDIRRAADEEADEFIYTPLTYDIGTCGNRCVLSQYTPHAVLRSVLRENIELKNNHTVYTHEVLKPACLPTAFGPLQVIFFSRVDNVMKLRLFKDVVVKECGCL